MQEMTGGNPYRRMKGKTVIQMKSKRHGQFATIYADFLTFESEAIEFFTKIVEFYLIINTFQYSRLMYGHTKIKQSRQLTFAFGGKRKKIAKSLKSHFGFDDIGIFAERNDTHDTEQSVSNSQQRPHSQARRHSHLGATDER